MTTELKEAVAEGNRRLVTAGLVTLTWGNLSAIDPETRLVAIKPSGVPYADLTAEHIVVMDLTGKQVAGALNPSSDTKTHLALYRAFPEIGAIVHTHSPHATAFSQAGRDLPCYGTTHADHFYGTVPLIRALTPEEVTADYEHHTGTSIIEHFQENAIHPLEMPACLLHHHAPFTWGETIDKAIDNSIALEMCAQMALNTLTLNPTLQSLPPHILDQHHQRKHGPNATYGQR